LQYQFSLFQYMVKNTKFSKSDIPFTMEARMARTRNILDTIIVWSVCDWVDICLHQRYLSSICLHQRYHQFQTYLLFVLLTLWHLGGGWVGETDADAVRTLPFCYPRSLEIWSNKLLKFYFYVAKFF
jgi:hypothetical protein